MHTIQLRGPWHYQLVSAAPDYPGKVIAEGRANLPADWTTVLAGTPQRVRFSRRFHCPSGIAASDRVDLVVEGLPATMDVRLNDLRLAATEAAAAGFRFDISQVLQPGNQLAIELQLDPARHYFGQVRLEIHSAGRQER